MKLIAISQPNVASRNIGRILIEKYKFKSFDKIQHLPIYTKKDLVLVECAEDVLHLGYLADYFHPDILVIASTHKSEAGINTLTCHSPGNWSSADLGGEPNTLAVAPALYIREALKELHKLRSERKKLEKYEVSLEVTHHGPTPNIPVLFVEVGSSKKQWQDLNACEAVADTIYRILSKKIRKPKTIPVVVGFGGTHYAPGFTRKTLENKLIPGHICPKYQADKLTEQMILQAFERTTPKPNFAAIEWKGLTSSQRTKIIEILNKNKIKWKKV